MMAKRASPHFWDLLARGASLAASTPTLDDNRNNGRMAQRQVASSIKVSASLNSCHFDFLEDAETCLAIFHNTSERHNTALDNEYTPVTYSAC